jgi:hypothetical protein
VSLGEWSKGVLTDLGTPPGLSGGFNRVRPFGINNSGAIVGTIYTSAGPVPSRTFIYNGGRFMVLPLVDPTDGGGAAIGINSRGEVVGYDNTSSNSVKGWLWSNGAYSSLPVYGTDTAALGINSSGTIIGNRTLTFIQRLLAGHYCCAGESGYVVSHGTTEYLTGYLMAINERGEVAGASTSRADGTATVFKNGIATSILSLPSCGFGINSSADIVGVYRPTEANRHAFFWSPQSGAFDVTPAGYRYALAAAINDRGDILGYGETLSGTLQYFLLTPDPKGELAPKKLMASPSAGR